MSLLGSMLIGAAITLVVVVFCYLLVMNWCRNVTFAILGNIK